MRPALQFEQLLATMYALAADGKTNRKGMPNPLRLAVIAKHHFDDVRLPFPPAWMQRLGLALGAPVGRPSGTAPSTREGTRRRQPWRSDAPAHRCQVLQSRTCSNARPDTDLRSLNGAGRDEYEHEDSERDPVRDEHVTVCVAR